MKVEIIYLLINLQTIVHSTHYNTGMKNRALLIQYIITQECVTTDENHLDLHQKVQCSDLS